MAGLKDYQKTVAQTIKPVARKERVISGAWGNGILDSDDGDDGLHDLFEIILGKKASNARWNDADSAGSDKYWVDLFKENAAKIKKPSNWLPAFAKKTNASGEYGASAILGVAYIWDKAGFGGLPKALHNAFYNACSIAIKEADEYNSPSARRKVIYSLAERLGITIKFKHEGKFDFFSKKWD